MPETASRQYGDGGIKLRRSIFDRLSVKVFLITFLVQVVFGALIIGALYKATPESFSDVQEEEVKEAFGELITTLEKTKKEDAGKLVDNFARATGSEVVFYQGDGFWTERTIYPLNG